MMDMIAEHLSESSNSSSVSSVSISNEAHDASSETDLRPGQDGADKNPPVAEKALRKRSGRKPRKKKPRVAPAVAPSISASSAPLPAGPNFRSFLEKYISCFNSHSMDCFRKLITTYAEPDAVYISRHWRYNDVRAEAPMNPLGMYNYCEMHGHVDILSNHRVLMSLIPDMCIYYQNVLVKDHDKNAIVSIVQIHIVGTVVSSIRIDALGGTSIHTSFLSVSSSAESGPPPTSTSAWISDEDTHLLRTLLFQEDHFAAVWSAKTHPSSRRLMQAPDLSLDPLRDLLSEPKPLDPLSAPLSHPVPPNVTSTSISTSVSASATSSSSHLSVAVRLAGEITERHLLRLPVHLRGLLICHFGSQGSDRVRRIEFHYYDSPRAGRDGEKDGEEMQDGVGRASLSSSPSSSSSPSVPQMEDGEKLLDGGQGEEISPALLLLLLRQSSRPSASRRSRKETDGTDGTDGKVTGSTA